jgi:hypothetical protein
MRSPSVKQDWVVELRLARLVSLFIIFSPFKYFPKVRQSFYTYVILTTTGVTYN